MSTTHNTDRLHFGDKFHIQTLNDHTDRLKVLRESNQTFVNELKTRTTNELRAYAVDILNQLGKQTDMASVDTKVAEIKKRARDTQPASEDDWGYTLAKFIENVETLEGKKAESTVQITKIARDEVAEVKTELPSVPPKRLPPLAVSADLIKSEPVKTKPADTVVPPVTAPTTKTEPKPEVKPEKIDVLKDVKIGDRVTLIMNDGYNLGPGIVFKRENGTIHLNVEGRKTSSLENSIIGMKREEVDFTKPAVKPTEASKPEVIADRLFRFDTKTLRSLTDMKIDFGFLENGTVIMIPNTVDVKEDGVLRDFGKAKDIRMLFDNSIVSVKTKTLSDGTLEITRTNIDKSIQKIELKAKPTPELKPVEVPKAEKPITKPEAKTVEAPVVKPAPKPAGATKPTEAPTEKVAEISFRLDNVSKEALAKMGVSLKETVTGTRITIPNTMTVTENGEPRGFAGSDSLSFRFDNDTVSVQTKTLSDGTLEIVCLNKDKSIQKIELKLIKKEKFEQQAPAPVKDVKIKPVTAPAPEPKKAQPSEIQPSAPSDVSTKKEKPIEKLSFKKVLEGNDSERIQKKMTQIISDYNSGDNSTLLSEYVQVRMYIIDTLGKDAIGQMTKIHNKNPSAFGLSVGKEGINVHILQAGLATVIIGTVQNGVFNPQKR